MLLFSPLRCDFTLSEGLSQTKACSSDYFSKSTWPVRTASSLVTLRSLQRKLLPQLTPLPAPYKVQRSNQLSSMSSPLDIHVGSPRSPLFSPTLNSIPEVFEYEPSAESPDATTSIETQDIPVYALPEPATMAVPAVSLRPTKEAIIVSPRRATATHTPTVVANALRNILEVDRHRRQRILRVYLKAIVFIKLMLKSHERYGAIMANSGGYMQR